MATQSVVTMATGILQSNLKEMGCLLKSSGSLPAAISLTDDEEGPIVSLNYCLRLFI